MMHVIVSLGAARLIPEISVSALSRRAVPFLRTHQTEKQGVEVTTHYQ